MRRLRLFILTAGLMKEIRSDGKNKSVIERAERKNKPNSKGDCYEPYIEMAGACQF